MAKIIYDRAALELKNVVYEIGLKNPKDMNNYIGHTGRAAKCRWAEHRRSFVKGTCNKNFKAHLKKDSIISFNILKVCNSKKEAQEWEKKLIRERQPNLNVIKYKK